MSGVKRFTDEDILKALIILRGGERTVTRKMLADATGMSREGMRPRLVALQEAGLVELVDGEVQFPRMEAPVQFVKMSMRLAITGDRTVIPVADSVEVTAL